MLVPKVAVHAHSQCAAVFVAEPAGDGGDVDAAFDAGGSEEVA